MAETDTTATQGFIYCARCKTRNPKGVERCENCGFVFGHSTVNEPQPESPPPAAISRAPRQEFQQQMVKYVPAAPEPAPTLAVSLQQPEPNIYRPKIKDSEGDILPGRPGLLTLYIAYMILQVVSTGLLVFVLNETLLQVSYLWWLDNLSFGGLLALLMVTTAYSVIMSVGLWQMKSWGRRLAMIAQVALLFLQFGVTLDRLASGLPFSVFWAQFAPVEAVRFAINAAMLWWLLTNRQRFE